MADYGVLHSLLASNLVKNNIEKQNPAFYARYYRLIYNFIGFVTLIPAGLLVVLLPDKVLYNIPYPFIMITLMVQGLAGHWGTGCFERNRSWIVPGVEPAHGNERRTGSLENRRILPLHAPPALHPQPDHHLAAAVDDGQPPGVHCLCHGLPADRRHI